MTQERKIYTLTELGKSLRSVIERNYSSTYWIKAEIAKLNFYPRSGHCYPELVDKTGNVIQAQMRSTIWAADFANTNKNFIKITGESLREGMSILFRASVTFHPMHGLSLQIWEIEPTFTLGEMALEKAQNLKKLTREGILDQNKLLPMPLLPQKIAVISVETSKGYHDFIQILKKQATRYQWWHFLFPSVLQGEKAVEGIISQLRIIKKIKDKFDLVAIIRGGGGDIGLSCYDDYNLSREIATFPLPVLTGIGHSTNETVAEIVAWANKITPTDVAYFLVNMYENFENRIEKASSVFFSRAGSIVNFQTQQLLHIENKITRYPGQIIEKQRNNLNALTNSVLFNSRKNLAMAQSNLTIGANKITSGIPSLIREKNQILEQLHSRLAQSTETFVKEELFQLDKLGLKQHLLDPENIMKRGYSVTFTIENKTAQPVNMKTGEQLVTLTHKGKIISTVTSTEPTE